MGELPKGWNILDTIDEKEESSDEDLPLVPALSPEEKSFQEAVYAYMNKQGLYFYFHHSYFDLISKMLSKI